MLRFIAALWLTAVGAQAAPPVVVIALDGFRYDYAVKHGARRIAALEREGATAEGGMIPAFPSVTFPNFHTMATGLVPERHGIVAMHFYDRALEREFSYRVNSREGFWYGGTPVWELAERGGILAATYFWPGSDAGVDHWWPSYHERYDGSITHEQKVEQVFWWLERGEAARPGLILVYFEDADAAGHRFGPDAEETRAAVMKVDATVGRLVDGIRARAPRADIVLLSDHGMSAVTKWIDFTGDADLAGCRTENDGPQTMLYCSDVEKVRAELTSKAHDYEVYRRSEMPAHLHYRNNARIGDLVVVPKGPYIVAASAPGVEPIGALLKLKGMHGYDPGADAEMRGILIGVGPSFRGGARVRDPRNEDVFALLAHLLGVAMPAGLDADFSRVRGLLE
jgi:predicted AlkP superfamily pyrophosphatase or phosphodiesterase